MNICTIATENWIEGHLARWMRYAKFSCPNAKLFLFCVTDEKKLHEQENYKGEILRQFDKVNYYPNLNGHREWFNKIRMKALSEFGVEEILYCDADADIVENLDFVSKESEGKDIAWVRSPGISGEWKLKCIENGWDKWGGNNGLLYIRKDLSEIYDSCYRTVREWKLSDRLAGTYAFNLMLKMTEQTKIFKELPYSTSVIWWDLANLLDAKVIQYCNDRGQEKRLRLETIYRMAF